MVPRWKTESTAEQSRAALGIRPRLPHRPETLVLYDAAGRGGEEPPDAVAGLHDRLGLGLGLGLGDGLDAGDADLLGGERCGALGGGDGR